MQLLYFVDNEPPVLVPCPTNQTKSIGFGRVTSTIEWINPEASDNSDANPTVVCSPSSGSDFGIGKTQVTCTATDRYGNSNSCYFVVKVQGTCMSRCTSKYIEKWCSQFNYILMQWEWFNSPVHGLYKILCRPCKSPLSNFCHYCTRLPTLNYS